MVLCHTEVQKVKRTYSDIGLRKQDGGYLFIDIHTKKLDS